MNADNMQSQTEKMGEYINIDKYRLCPDRRIDNYTHFFGIGKAKHNVTDKNTHT